MKATVINGERDIRVETVPDPIIRKPTDAIVSVVAACVCGSDLWSYRGVKAIEPGERIGHEFVGVVEAVGDDVENVRPGDFVIAPFTVSDGTCPHCRNGIYTSCQQVGWWGSSDDAGMIDGGQGEIVRVPLADGTLVVVPDSPPNELIPSLLTLSDVMGTGHHAARAAGVGKGSNVIVVGDGAVGQCAVLAARRLGADRIVIMSRHPDRQNLARTFGATDVIAQRGEDGVAAALEVFDGVGADSVLECVGTKQSMEQAIGVARPGGRVGYVGVPAGGPELPIGKLFSRNVWVGGGVAPVRGYIEELLADVLAGTIDPGKVFDGEFPLERAADAYAAMDERTTIKSLLWTGR